MPLPLIALLALNLAWSDDLPTAEPRFDKIVAWHDPSYSDAAWNYLLETDPASQDRWPGLPPRDQARLLALASEKGPARHNAAIGRLREILGLCGMSPKKEECDLKPLSEVTDEELRVIAVWRSEHSADFIRKRRDLARAKLASGPEAPAAPAQIISQSDKLLFDDPREKALSDTWNRFFVDDFQSNSVGQGILEHLKSGLPPMKVAKLQGDALADFSPALVSIRVNSVFLAQEIRFHDPELTVDDPKALTEYLLSHGDVSAAVFKAYRGVEAHEATHAVQSEAFRDDLLHERDKADFLEAERHAFTVSHRLTLAALEADSAYLASMSPISKMSRDSLTACLVDYERCMAAVGPAYTHAHELATAIRGADPAKSALILERMKGFYEDFDKETRQGWKEKNSRGLLLLAERLPAAAPREAALDLIALENLLPAEVHGGELRPRFEAALERALAAYADEVRTAGDAGRARELEAICRHFGRKKPQGLP